VPIPEEQIVEFGNGRFKTRVLTAGAGDPLVFLHGASGLLWDPFLDALAERHRVIAPEHPRVGETQGLEHLHDLWDLVLYYGALLDELGLPTTELIGHSFGGMVAAEVAATSPERVTKLVLLCPIGFWHDEHPVPDIARLTPDQLPGLVLADPEGPLAAALAGPDPNDPEAMFHAAMAMSAINQFIWPLPDKGLSKRLYRVKADTLVIWGMNDRLVDPAYGDDFVNGIARARLELVPAAGHLPQLEQPQLVLSSITSFLS
jgi:pimeloyl-ACP methyl ester carboxylesterase